jgi:hypothetical protein
MTAGQGLAEVPTDALKRLLAHLHRGDLICPVSPARLATVGFQYKTEVLMNALRHVDETGVRAILVCVLAERTHHQGEAE